MIALPSIANRGEKIIAAKVPVDERRLCAWAALCLLAVSGALASGGAFAGTPAASSAAGSACPPPPTLALLPDFEDLSGAFRPNSQAFRSVEKRFAAAYRIACRKGGLSTPLMRPEASDASRLFLKNAPNANTASIYQEGFEDAAPTRPMVLEYPFIGANGRRNLPSIEELRSAIVCSVYYAAPPSGGVGDVLECLVD